MSLTQFGTVNTTALAEYFIRRYNIVGRDAEYQKDRPTLQWLPRDTEKLKQGDSFFETLKIAGGFSMAADWVKGNTYHNPSTKVRWQVSDPYSQYGYLTFDNLALNRNNTGTLIDIKSTEADDVVQGMLDTAEFELWNDGTGNRGQVSSGGGSGATLTLMLATASDVYNFSFGMMLVSNTAADGSGSDHTNVYKVTDLNPVAGTITVSKTVDNSSAIANSDYLFSYGTKNLMMPGIPTFIPSADPSDTLLGVSRTGNPALSGWRFPFKASIAETIARSFNTMGRWVNRGRRKFVVCLSVADWMLLSFERESKLVYEDPTAVEKWGLSGLMVNTAFGPVTCVGIPQLKDGRGYIVDWSTWRLYTLKNLPHVIDEDGLTFVRGGVSTPDNNVNGDWIKMQFRLWKILLCLQPMSNATFPTK